VTSAILLAEDLPYSIEEVWTAVTDSAHLGDWLMPNDFEPLLGRRFTLRCPPGAGVRGWVDCVVLELEPPRRMVWSWSNRSEAEPSQVEFRLEPTAGGTRLTLIHSREADAEQRRRFTSGWKEKLPLLRRLLAKVD
jgi:uncharacterized protein YndB with AHSA1/START domain